MTRDITITFADGSTHTYKNAPDTITPETVQKRAQAQFGKPVTSIDGGRESPSVGADGTPPEDSKGYLTKIREGAESIIEPVATLASGLVAAPVAGFTGMVGDAYSGLTGEPRIGEQVASDVMQGMTYAPRSEGAKQNLESLGKLLDKSKLAGLPVAGSELSLIQQGVKSGAKLAAPLIESKIQSIGVGTQDLASKVMINALKGTPTQLLKGDVKVAADELLKRGLSPNEKGIAALEARIAELNSEIANKIGSSTALINKQKVLDRLQGVRDRFVKTVNPESDLAAIQNVGTEFSRHPLASGENIPIQLAQEMKKATGLELRKKYGELGSAQTEAQKSIVRGLKEEIAAAEPSVASLNAEERALFRTLNVAERRSFMEMNKDPVPLYGALRSPTAWAAFTADKSTAFKALIARTLNKVGKKLSGPAMEKPQNKFELALDDSPLPQSQPQPMHQGRGLLSLSDEQMVLPKIEFQPQDALDFPLQPRNAPLYQRGGIPQETGLSLSAPEPTMPAIPYSTGEAPKGRGLLSLSDEKISSKQNGWNPHEKGTIDFKLRQQVMDDLAPTTDALRQQLSDLMDKAEKQQGFWKNRTQTDIKELEQYFRAGLKQIGIDKPSDAWGQAIYSFGGETTLPIQKSGRSGMLTGAKQ